MATLGEVARAAEEDEEVHMGGYDVDSTAGDEAHGSRKVGGTVLTKTREDLEKSWKDFTSMLRAPLAAPKNPRVFAEKAGSKIRSSYEAAAARAPSWLKKQVTFYRIHFTCFVVVMLIGSFVLWVSPNGDGGRISFVDSMYVATSALCVTGLISVSMNQLSTFDKVFLMVLMIVGSQVFTSLVPVFVRRYYFKKYLEREGIHDFDSIAGGSARRASVAGGAAEDSEAPDLAPLEEEEGETSRSRSKHTGVPQPREGPAGDEAAPEGGAVFERPSEATSQVEAEASVGAHSRRVQSMDRQPAPAPRPTVLFQSPSLTIGATFGGSVHGPRQNGAATTSLTAATGTGLQEAVAARRSQGGNALLSPEDTPGMINGRDDLAQMSSNTWAGDTAQMNARRLRALLSLKAQSSATPNLQKAPSMFQREGSQIDAEQLLPGERRFIELRALEMLCWLVPLYFSGFVILCFVILFICIIVNPHYTNLLRSNGVDPVFMAAFQSVSAFANAGLSLLDDNLISFQAYVPYLLFVMLLILVGNTMYAPTLRFLLLLIARFGTEHQRLVSGYLLDHPRKCYTHLFPPSDTRWLLFTVLLFNSTEFIFFCALDWNSTALTGLSGGVKILDGVFQSVSTRNAGYNVVAIALLSSAMLVLYVGMMYVAVYPVYITRQRSRQQREVYDNEDLQIFYEDLEEGVLDKGVLGQGKKMFSRDSAFLFIAIFVLCIIQNSEIKSDPSNFSVFTITFEVISAYGNVGLTLGYTCPPDNASCVGVPYSFSGVWKTGAKIVIILVMLIGRHRGLPDNIDAAIVIPGKKQFRRTQSTAPPGDAHILIRVGSSTSLPGTLGPGASGMTRRTSSIVQRSPVAPEEYIRTVSGDNISPHKASPLQL